MHIERILGVIPARLRSERLPNKPLHLLAGRPLIEWVWRRVSSFQMFDQIVIATDAAEVADVCRAFGATVELTSPEHPSGTDRVAEVMAMPAYARYETAVNVQGDEPFVTPDQIEVVLAAVAHGFDVGTVSTPVRTLDAWRDPAVVKVVRRDNGAALYFSRATIPYERNADPDAAALGSERYLRHIGVYAYTRSALQRWVQLPVGDLERIERLEQLRPLAAGLSIGVGIVADAENGVDTPADAMRAAMKLKQSGDAVLSATSGSLNFK